MKPTCVNDRYLGYIKMNRFAKDFKFGIQIFFYIIYLCSTWVSDFTASEDFK